MNSRRTALFATAMLATVLCGGRESMAAISIPPNLDYPDPGRLPAYRLDVDSGVRVRTAALFPADPLPPLQPGMSVGDLSMFLKIPIDPPQTAPDPELDKQIANEFFKAVLPPDDDPFSFEVGDRFVVARQSASRDGNLSARVEDSAFVRVNRFVNKLPVFGTGSVAVVQVRERKVVGAVIRWNLVAEPQPDVDLFISRSTLREQLRQHFPHSALKIIKVLSSPEVVYFGDRNTLKPKYRVIVSIDHRDGAPADHEEVFLPEEPSAASGPTNDVPSSCTRPVVEPASGVRVDRYAYDGDNGMWALNGLAFGAALQPSGGFGGRRFCFLVDSMLTPDHARYVDGPAISLIESHGLPGRIKARIVQGDFRFVPLEDAGGYGSNANGLRLLILHSCEAIPTYDDENAAWPLRWWTIFRGLHMTVGYRTTMSIDDGVSTEFGRHLDAQEEIMRSWFAEVAAVSTYKQATKTGRASAVSVCKEQYATPAQLKQLSTPDCLVSYWFPD